MERIMIQLEPTLTTRQDIPAVLDMLKQAPPETILDVTEDKLMVWIDAGHSLVAKLKSGLVVAHQAATIWPESGWIEGRAALVREDFRSYGIGTKMKQAIDEIMLEEFPGATIASFTEANSGIRGIVQSLGYKRIPLIDTPSEFFTLCPSNCVLKTGHNCGCQVFVKHTS
jgi:GNAT superfamily N-acetyltransferase